MFVIAVVCSSFNFYGHDSTLSQIIRDLKMRQVVSGMMGMNMMLARENEMKKHREKKNHSRMKFQSV